LNLYGDDTTGTNAMQAQLDMNSNYIHNLAAPVNNSDAATKKYIDDVVAAIATLGLSGVSAFMGTVLDDTSAYAATQTMSTDYVVSDITAAKGLGIPSSARTLRVLYRASVNDGYHGVFVWNSSDLSAEVTADTQNGIYIPPNSDTTGASGAWVRQFPGAVNVLWFGATGDGVTNDSTSVQSAVDSGENRIYFPAGTYVLADIVLKDGQHIFGDGFESVLEKESSGVHILRTFDGSSAYDNIRITDLKFNGLSETAFNESNFQVIIRGSENVVIEWCYFRAFEGDAIYFGGFAPTGANTPHPKNVWIKNNIFDGVNNENRNAISLTNGENVWIKNNYFVNCTKSTMPGAIDMEPNYDSDRLNEIHINSNIFDAIGGTAGAVSLVSSSHVQDTVDEPYSGIYITNNTMKNLTANWGITLVQGASTTPKTAPPNNIHVINNTIRDSVRGMNIDGVKTIHVRDNDIYNTTNVATQIGSNYEVYDLYYENNSLDTVATSGNPTVSLLLGSFIKINNNYFHYASGGDGRPVIEVTDITELSIDNNEFNDCGKADGTDGKGVRFLPAGTTDGVSLRNNKFTAGSRFTYAFDYNLSHTTTTSKNVVQGNEYDGLLLNNIDEFDLVIFTDGDTTPSVRTRRTGVVQFETANTGATSITDFDDAYPSQIINIRIDSNTTIANGGSILLAGGADFTGDTNDNITLINVRSDVWREVSRSVN